MIARLSTHYTMLVPKHVLDAGGDLEENLVGSGAFKWVSYRKGASLKTERNSDYHLEGLPYLNGVHIFPVAEQATRMASLRAGNLDQFTRWGSVNGQAALSIKAAEPRIIIDALQRASVGNIVFDNTQEPWKDVRARRAVSLAFDRQKAIAVVGGGLGALGVLPFLGENAIPQDDLIQRPGYRQPKDEDIAEAQRLWKAAGVTKDLDLVITVRAGTVFHENLGVFMKSELDGVFGVNVTVRSIEYVAFQKLYRQGGYGIITATASNGIPTDPDGIAIHMGAAGALNHTTPKRVLELFDQQSASTDPAERLRLVREIQEVWLEEAPAVAAFLVTLAQPRWDYVKNFEPGFSVYNQVQYDTVWLAEK
jgi:peptide/nickel transport system substrate-binding protein